MAKKKRSFLDQIQTWSVGMDQLFNDEIHQAVANDQRTTTNGNMNPLGYPYGLLQPKVLQNGRADFSKAYRHSNYGLLSAKDRVLLYCFMNLRGHFHSSRANFRLRKKWLLDTFLNNHPIMIDIGCGPATSALALAELYPGQKFSYMGVDSATAMRNRGTALLAAATQRGVVHLKTSHSFVSNWNKLPDTYPTGSTVMFNFAFFFASKTLGVGNLKSLANKIERIGSHLNPRRVIISYTNSVEQIANKNYVRFLDILQVEPKSGRSTRTVQYRNRRHHYGPPNKQQFSRELYEMEF